MKYNIELEKEAINLGFKKKWLDDKSGYWLEKNVKFKDLHLNFVIESDHKLFLMQVKTGEYFSKKVKLNLHEDVAKFKCNLQTIKKVIKNYK